MRNKQEPIGSSHVSERDGDMSATEGPVGDAFEAPGRTVSGDGPCGGGPHGQPNAGDILPPLSATLEANLEKAMAENYTSKEEMAAGTGLTTKDIERI